MRNVCKISLLIVVTMIFVIGSSVAESGSVNPNGFPSGFHYNLNITGKKDNFTCPQVLCDYLIDPYCDDNVIFVPANGTGIEIKMESGRKSTATDISVTDWCAGMFGQVDEGSATVKLPPNDAGYDVYARALATPSNNPQIRIVENNLEYVQDESGNGLYYLGTFVKNCVTTPSAPECTFTRTKGKSTAVNITPLFQWSGEICYFDPIGYCDPLVDCPATQLCCDNVGTIDLPIYDNCQIKDPLLPCTNTEVTAYCKTYSDPTWVFNIGDFVGYLWSMDNSGVKLLQIRFYPRSQ